MKKAVPAVNTSEFYVGLFIVFLIVATVKYFFPTSIPFELFEFFKFSFNWEALLGIPWMLLLFGPVLSLVVSILTKNSRSENWQIKDGFDHDIWTSIKAGIFEEISYRWLTFYFLIIAFSIRDVIFTWLMSISWISAILSLPWWAIVCILLVVNVIGLISYVVATDKSTGCLISTIGGIVLVFVIIIDLTVALGLVKWWYTDLMLPLINFITLGKMNPQLFGYSWMVGAALVSSNWDFGKGHLYQGPVGWLNSWIFGMLMFWFTFHFGLLFAMLIHAIYDIVIHVIRYVDANLELIAS